MSRVIALLLKLDAAVQQRFDSVCFFLMSKCGVRKSMLRYLLAALMIVGIAAVAVDLKRHGHVWLAALAFLYLAVLLLVQHAIVLVDQKVEDGEPKAVSLERYQLRPSSRRNRRKFRNLVLLLATSLVPFGTYGLTLTGLRIAWTSSLFLLYLAQTPMNPPGEAAQEPAAASETAAVQA